MGMPIMGSAICLRSQQVEAAVDAKLRAVRRAVVCLCVLLGAMSAGCSGKTPPRPPQVTAALLSRVFQTTTAGQPVLFRQIVDVPAGAGTLRVAASGSTTLNGAAGFDLTTTINGQPLEVRSVGVLAYSRSSDTGGVWRAAKAHAPDLQGALFGTQPPVLLGLIAGLSVSPGSHEEATRLGNGMLEFSVAIDPNVAAARTSGAVSEGIQVLARSAVTFSSVQVVVDRDYRVRRFQFQASYVNKAGMRLPFSIEEQVTGYDAPVIRKP